MCLLGIMITIILLVIWTKVCLIYILFLYFIIAKNTSKYTNNSQQIFWIKHNESKTNIVLSTMCQCIAYVQLMIL